MLFVLRIIQIHDLNGFAFSTDGQVGTEQWTHRQAYNMLFLLFILSVCVTTKRLNAFH